MTKIKRDQLSGILLVIIGLIVAFLVNQFKTPMTASYPGPKLLPLISVTGLVICGSGIFITSTIKKDEKEGEFLDSTGWKKIGATLITLVAYVVILKYLGYFVATPIVLYTLITLFAKGNSAESITKSRILFSVIFTVLLYLIYVQAFGMKFPMGMLFG